MSGMECGCLTCGDEWDSGPSVYSTKGRTARVAHKCCECGEPIHPGEQYEHFTGLYDGHWSTFKTCVPCQRIRDAHCCRGYVFGDLREVLRDALGLDYVTNETVDDEDGLGG